MSTNIAIKILGVDPGTTTGLCKLLYFPTEQRYESLGSRDRRITPLQLGPQQHHEELYKLLTTWNPDIVVCESFTYQRRDKVVLDSVEYIGVCKLYCAMTRTQYFEQSPSMGKAFWKDEKIKQLKLWEPSMGHAMDALRHVLQFIMVSLKDNQFVMALR